MLLLQYWMLNTEKCLLINTCICIFSLFTSATYYLPSTTYNLPALIYISFIFPHVSSSINVLYHDTQKSNNIKMRKTYQEIEKKKISHNSGFLVNRAVYISYKEMSEIVKRVRKFAVAVTSKRKVKGRDFIHIPDLGHVPVGIAGGDKLSWIYHLQKCRLVAIHLVFWTCRCFFLELHYRFGTVLAISRTICMPDLCCT